MRNARAIFATNFFGIAGYEINSIVNDNSVEEGVKEIVKEKPGIIVLCSSDEEYTTLGIEYLKALKQTNIPVVIAGNPGENETLFRENGAHSFIHVRTLALDALEDYQKVLSVK